MTEVEVNINPSSTIKEYNKIRYTNLFFTINLNKSFREGDSRIELAEEYFTQALRELLSKERMKDYVVFKEENHFFSPKYIKNIKIDIQLEIGEQKRMLHAHGLISISHWSKISFDFGLLKERLKQILGLDNIYINFKLFYDSKRSIQDYIHKTAHV